MRIGLLLLGLTLPLPLLAQLRVQDCARVFPNVDGWKAVRMTDSTWLAQAWDNGYAPGEEKLLGYVLHRVMAFEGDTADLIVGVDPTGKIVKVVVDEPLAADEEFLLQFCGRSRQDSLILAQQPQDLLFVPARIKPMRGRVALSAAIIRHLNAALQAAPALLN